MPYQVYPASVFLCSVILAMLVSIAKKDTC
jgi:hypothetical protein